MSSSVLETKTYFFNRLGLEYGSTMFDLGNLKGKGYIRGLLRGKTTKRLKSHFVGTLFFWMSLNGSRPSNLWLHKFIVLLITLSIYCRHSPFVLLISFVNLFLIRLTLLKKNIIYLVKLQMLEGICFIEFIHSWFFIGRLLNVYLLFFQKKNNNNFLVDFSLLY